MIKCSQCFVPSQRSNAPSLFLQKEKAVNDKKEDKKTKKAKENAEAEANEENHSENGDAKTNEVSPNSKSTQPWSYNTWIWGNKLMAGVSDLVPCAFQVEAAPEEAKEEAKSE